MKSAARIAASAPTGLDDGAAGRASPQAQGDSGPAVSAKTQAQTAWADRAETYARLAAPITSLAIPTLLSLGDIRAGRRVIDLGCGPGWTTGAAFALGADALGVDFTPAMITQARQRFPTVQFMIGQADAMDVRADDFDAAVSNFSLALMEAPDRVLKEALRALKPGGRLAFSAWASPEETPLFVAARRAAGLREAGGMQAFGFASETAAKRALRTAGFDQVETASAQFSIDGETSEAALMARLLDPELDAALSRSAELAEKAQSAAASVLGGGVRFRSRVSARFYVAVKPGTPARLEDDAEPPAEKRAGFGVVRRLLGRG